MLSSSTASSHPGTPAARPSAVERRRKEDCMALGLSKLLTSTAAALDRRFGWDKLPRPLGVLTLVGLRTRLREKNLYDTGTGSATAAPSGGPHNTRTFDGSYTDLEQ